MGCDSGRLVDHDQLADFIARHSRCFLFCRDGTEAPIGYAMNVIGYGRGSLFFTTYTKSPKVAHLRGDHEAACVVLGSEEATNSWITVRGSAEVYHPSAQQFAEIEPMVLRQLKDPRVPESVIVKALDRLRSGKRVVVRLVVEEADVVIGDPTEMQR